MSRSAGAALVLSLVGFALGCVMFLMYRYCLRQGKNTPYSRWIAWDEEGRRRRREEKQDEAGDFELGGVVAGKSKRMLSLGSTNFVFKFGAGRSSATGSAAEGAQALKKMSMLADSGYVGEAADEPSLYTDTSRSFSFATQFETTTNYGQTMNYADAIPEATSGPGSGSGSGSGSAGGSSKRRVVGSVFNSMNPLLIVPGKGNAPPPPPGLPPRLRGSSDTSVNGPPGASSAGRRQGSVLADMIGPNSSRLDPHLSK